MPWRPSDDEGGLTHGIYAPFEGISVTGGWRPLWRRRCTYLGHRYRPISNDVDRCTRRDCDSHRFALRPDTLPEAAGGSSPPPSG
jgi:hypothetical protein